MARRGESAREAQQAIKHWLRRRWRPWRIAKKTLVGLFQAGLKLAVILPIGAYGSVTFIHLTNGFSFQTSLGAGFQDARLLVTCPRDVSLQWQFIDRSQIEQVGLGLALNLGEHIYSDICSRSTVRLAERGQKEMDARQKGLVTPQQTDEPSKTETPLQFPPPVKVERPRPTNAPTPAIEMPSVIVTLSTPEPKKIPSVIVQESSSIPPLVDLRFHLLYLINQDRAANGLSPVTLGDNPAAQKHAEEMLEHSYLSHWGLDGLKPYMRYTLAGGVNYEAENASGIERALGPEGLYGRISPKEELFETQQGWMESEGHRVNILNPWHKKVSLGIACNRITCAAIEQFEGDYISFRTEPTLSSGRLSMAGRLSGGFELSGVQIWYDQLPQQLTLGQLDTTYCYSHGRPVVFLREPVPPGSYYLEASSSFSWRPCQSPYDASADTPRLKPSGFVPRSYLVGLDQVPWTTADLWQVAGERFNIRADISEALIKHGTGVYTVHIWGENAGEEIVLSNYSIFYEGK